MISANKQIHTQLQLDWSKKQENMLAENQHQEEVMLKTLEEHDKKASDHLERLKILYQKHVEVGSIICPSIFTFIHSNVW